MFQHTEEVADPAPEEDAPAEESSGDAGAEEAAGEAEEGGDAAPVDDAEAS